MVEDGQPHAGASDARDRPGREVVVAHRGVLVHHDHDQHAGRCGQRCVAAPQLHVGKSAAPAQPLFRLAETRVGGRVAAGQATQGQHFGVGRGVVAVDEDVVDCLDRLGVCRGSGEARQQREHRG
jgi:hypothetical protein